MKISGSQPHIYLHSTFFCARKSPRGSCDIIGIKEPSAERQQHLKKELPKAHTGDQFAQTDSKHKERNALETMGGIAHRKRFLRSAQDPKAPSSVARVPKITSGSTHPVRILLRRQPSVRPGIAAGVKKGMIVRASEKRTCMAPLARSNPAATMVRTV